MEASLLVAAPLTLAAGERVAILDADNALFTPRLVAAGRLPRLTMGMTLTPPAGPALQLIGTAPVPGDGDAPACRLYTAKALEAGVLPAGPAAFTITKKGLALAWVTLSDKGSQGLRADAAGPAIAETCAASLPLALAQGHLIPDEPAELRALLLDLAVTQGFDLIVTTGGTGLSPRDTTPEATLGVIEKRLPGFETAMLLASLSKTPHAMLSRATAGAVARAIVINVPGSPKAVRETLAAVMAAIPHGLDKLRGDPSDCGQG